MARKRVKGKRYPKLPPNQRYDEFGGIITLPPGDRWLDEVMSFDEWEAEVERKAKEKGGNKLHFFDFGKGDPTGVYSLGKDSTYRKIKKRRK